MHGSDEKSSRSDLNADIQAVPDGQGTRILTSISFFGFLATVALMAIPFGAADKWVQSLFVSLICLFSALRISESLIRGSFSIAEPRLLLPLAGILLLSIIQVMPLDGIPALLSGLRNTSAYISADPNETKQFLLIFAALILLGEGLLYYATTRNRLVFIVGTILLVGLGSAVAGFLPRLFDIPPRLDSTAGHAQFYNRNHFALLMEMTLGLLLGFALRGHFSPVIRVVCWILIVFIGSAIISSNSRGGIVSAAVMIVVSVLLYAALTWNRKGRSKSRKAGGAKRIAAPVLAAAAILIFVAGSFVLTIALIGGDQLVTRFERIGDDIRQADDRRVSRVEIWKSTFKLIEDSSVTGAGFGAYETAVTPFDTSTGGRFKLQQAHNEYLEIAAGGGLLGVIFTVWFLAVLANTARRRFDSGDRFIRASRLGAAAGIFGVLLHSIVDFGLHIFVNAAIFTLLIVLAVSRVEREHDAANSIADGRQDRKKRSG